MRRKKPAQAIDCCCNVENDFVHMAMMLMVHTTPLRSRLSRDVVGRLKDLQVSLTGKSSDLRCTQAVVDLASAYARNDGQTVGKVHASLLEVYCQRDMADKLAGHQADGFTFREPVYELFVQVLESMAYELNLEKPAHAKVAEVDPG